MLFDLIRSVYSDFSWDFCFFWYKVIGGNCYFKCIVGIFEVLDMVVEIIRDIGYYIIFDLEIKVNVVRNIEDYGMLYFVL